MEHGCKPLQLMVWGNTNFKTAMMPFSQFSALIPPDIIHPAHQYLCTALLGDIDNSPWDSESLQEAPMAC